MDVYHGYQHLAQAGDRLYGECKKESATFLDRGRKLLLKSGWLGICHLVGAEYEKEDTTVRRKALENLMGYFAKHTHRLNYRDQLEKGGAIGGGRVGQDFAAETEKLRCKVAAQEYFRNGGLGFCPKHQTMGLLLGQSCLITQESVAAPVECFEYFDYCVCFDCVLK